MSDEDDVLGDEPGLNAYAAELALKAAALTLLRELESSIAGCVVIQSMLKQGMSDGLQRAAELVECEARSQEVKHFHGHAKVLQAAAKRLRSVKP